MAKYRKLSRTSSQRKALLRGQVTALLNNGKIVTTEVTLRNPDCVIRTDFLYYQSAWDLYADGALYAPEEVENVDLAFAVYAEN